MAAVSTNPFAVQTPEHLAAADVISLFVQELSDYWQILNPSHTLIYGPRGAGKSMIFRFMEPDCQVKNEDKDFSQLSYYAAYVPIKETELNLSEFFRLEEARHAPLVLNEHLMVANVASKLFSSFANRAPITSLHPEQKSELSDFYFKSLAPALSRSGWSGQLSQISDSMPPLAIMSEIADVFDRIYAEANSYLRRMAFLKEPQPYDGPLFGYMDFLAPLIKKLGALSFMPSGPVYLLIDDADNLNLAQTQILNSWVASRTTGYLCLKISTQTLDYKTYRTPNGKRIDAPHDFTEVQICDIYTTKKDTYRDRVHRIVERRLTLCGVSSSPENFFPEDKQQEAEIEEMGARIRADFEVNGRGAKASDDALRYSRPNFIKALAGSRKSGSSYSYAGFNQLVHISSGVIRHFLDAASIMYGETRSRQPDVDVNFIPPGIQNSAVRELADKLLFSNFADMERDEGSIAEDGRDRVRKLRNLINALGGMFYQILISDAAERRVFSIALTDVPTPEVQDILNLGVKYGYFHQSSIGNKEGTGRVPLYIMSRRLAPAFKLDPTSFAGYKFVKNVALIEAMERPKGLLNRVRIRGFDAVMESDMQGDLFE